MSSPLPHTHSPWNIRFLDWLNQTSNPLDSLLPPLIDIVLEYAYVDTLILLHNDKCISFCPGLDKEWLIWPVSSNLPDDCSSHACAVGCLGSSLAVACCNGDRSVLLHHSKVQKPNNQWKPLHSHLQDCLHSIEHILKLENRNYYIGTIGTTIGTMAFGFFPSFVSSSHLDNVFKILTPPPPISHSTALVVPPRLGNSFDCEVDTTISGVILIMGGHYGLPPGPFRSRFAFYNPLRNIWQELPSLPRARNNKPTCILLKDQVLVFGGVGADFHRYVREIDSYCLITHTWSTLPYSLPRLPDSYPPSFLHSANHLLYAFHAEDSHYLCFALDILNPNAEWTREAILPISIGLGSLPLFGTY